MRTLKSNVTLFEGPFMTGNAGEPKQYLASDEVRRLFGQASAARVSFVGTAGTPNARLTLRLWDTASPDQRPSELGDGYGPTWTSNAIANLVPQPIDISGPFCDNVDLVLEITDNGSQAAERWDGAVYATLFFD